MMSLATKMQQYPMISCREEIKYGDDRLVDVNSLYRNSWQLHVSDHDLVGSKYQLVLFSVKGSRE